MNCFKLIFFLFITSSCFSQSAKKQNETLKELYNNQRIEYNLLYDKANSAYKYRNQLILQNRQSYLESKNALFKINNKNTELEQLSEKLSALEINYTLKDYSDYITNDVEQLAESLFNSYLSETNVAVEKDYFVAYSFFPDSLPKLKIKKQNALLISLLDSITRTYEATYRLSEEINSEINYHENLKRMIDIVANPIKKQLYNMENSVSFLNDLLLKEKYRYAESGPKGFSDNYKKVFPEVFYNKPAVEPIEREVLKNNGHGYFPSLVDDNSATASAVNRSEILNFVDQEAEFSGGPTGLNEFIKTNLKSPKTSLEKGNNGKCYLRFVVHKDGSISNVTVLKGISECNDCSTEAIRLIRSMPKWKPATFNGEIVDSYYNLVITF